MQANATYKQRETDKEMKKQNKRKWVIVLISLAAFTLWTAAVRLVDIQAIGPQRSAVGFAALNGWFHGLTGVHMVLYTITDWLSLVPLGFVIGFACLGLVQWIRRESILKVDRSILILGGFYLVVMAAFVLFEVCVVNYRPVLIEGVLEASYPSSTTLLVLCVMPTAIMQLKDQIKNKVLNLVMISLISLFIIFMVIGRLISGVHWVTDIIGGILLSSGLVMMYYSFVSFLKK